MIIHISPWMLFPLFYLFIAFCVTLIFAQDKKVGWFIGSVIGIFWGIVIPGILINNFRDARRRRRDKW